MIKSLLQLEELKDWKHDLDSPETTILHGEIVRKKPFLKRLYKEWYALFKKESQSLPEGIRLELGSGAGFIKEFIPAIITTDVLPLPNIDRVMSAEKLDFPDNSISGIFMIDVLHHIPHPAYFLKEAERCLFKGGKIILIEPANSWWGRFIYQNFHHEPFDPKAGWELEATGPLSGANGAMPWIILERDRQLFKEKFPELSIQSIRYHTPFRYLLSGGVSMKSLVPGWSFSFFSWVDRMASNVGFSMFQTAIIKKS